MLEKIRNFDMFGSELPKFNINGKAKVTTLTGAFGSIVILAMTLMFALLKLEHMINRKNPLISRNIESLDGEEIYDTG